MSSAVVDKDKGWAKILKQAIAADGPRYAKVGVLADDKGEEHEEGAALTIAEIAAILELGTEDGSIPARPFIRSTFDEQRAELEKMAIELVVEVTLFGLAEDVALHRLGAKLAAEIKKKITSGQGIPPPNAPSTAIAKAMKGRTSRFFAQKKQRNVGDALADVATTQYVEGLGGHGRGGRRAVGAARSLGDAFAQVGAIASVRTLVDTGRMLGAISWVIAQKDE